MPHAITLQTPGYRAMRTGPARFSRFPARFFLRFSR
jgi:hypothetical protein